jgi:hypothetical protein
MEASTSSGLAVSALMQQLKSGEISKMQLFQQLAKLQVASQTASSNAVPTTSNQTSNFNSNANCQVSFSALGVDTAPSFSPAFAFKIAGYGASGVATGVTPQFNPTQTGQFVFGAAVAPLPPNATTTPENTGTSRSFSMPTMPDPAAMASKAGATIVESDAEFLATGVSHDKAKRFSVQEWMANKTRASASSQVSNALRLHYQQQSQPQAAEVPAPVLSYERPFDRRNEELQDPFGFRASTDSLFTPHCRPTGSSHSSLGDPRNSLNHDRAEATRQGYMYAPQHDLSGQAQLVDEDFGRKHDEREGEQQFLDFTEQFRDDLDDAHGGNNGGKVGASGSNNNTDGKFHARVTRWKSQKDAIREQMKQQLLQSELDECTFAPKINPKSTKVVAKLRGRQSASVSNQGLSVLQAVSERLYQEADNYRIREELATKLKADEEAEIERQCTFKPIINKSDKVKAKYMASKPAASSALTAASREAAAKELAECTFYPKVNGIKSEMVSAQLYLQQNIYERLSKPCCGDAEDGKSPARAHSGRRRSLSLFGDEEEEEEIFDAGSPRSIQDDISLRPGGKSRRRSSSGARGGPRSVDAERNQESKEERTRQFKDFIERQKFHEQARHKRLELTKQQLTPGYKPTINKKSLAMMENGRKGDFLERISTYALRKEHDNVKKKTVRSSVGSAHAMALIFSN